MNVITQIRNVRIKHNEEFHKLHTPAKIIAIIRPKNFEMVSAYCIQIMSRIDSKEDKTLKTKEQMSNMDRTEIVQEIMDGIKRAECGHWWADMNMATHIPVACNGCTFLTNCATPSVSKILHTVTQINRYTA